MGFVNASIDVPIQFLSALIGAGGEHIEDLRRQSGCSIHVCLLTNHNQILLKIRCTLKFSERLKPASIYVGIVPV